MGTSCYTVAMLWPNARICLRLLVFFNALLLGAYDDNEVSAAAVRQQKSRDNRILGQVAGKSCVDTFMDLKESSAVG